MSTKVLLLIIVIVTSSFSVCCNSKNSIECTYANGSRYTRNVYDDRVITKVYHISGVSWNRTVYRNGYTVVNSRNVDKHGNIFDKTTYTNGESWRIHVKVTYGSRYYIYDNDWKGNNKTTSCYKTNSGDVKCQVTN